MTTIVLFNPQQGHQAITRQLWPMLKANLTAGKRMVVTAQEQEDAKSAKQRRYYHGVILTEIADQAKANGQKFPMPVWKEYLRDRFVGYRYEAWRDPMTGKKRRRKVRISTEDLGIKAYSRLIEEVTAFAVVELGVRFSVSRWEDYQVDLSTGEIVGMA